MKAMLDNPKGRDCNEMVGYQVRQELIQMTAETLETASISTSLLDFVKNLTK